MLQIDGFFERQTIAPNPPGNYLALGLFKTNLNRPESPVRIKARANNFGIRTISLNSDIEPLFPPPRPFNYVETCWNQVDSMLSEFKKPFAHPTANIVQPKSKGC